MKADANASAETVFSQLKREMVYRNRFRTRAEAEQKINRYFAKIFNPILKQRLKRNALAVIKALASNPNPEPGLFDEDID